jgi:hypothetical protein
LWTADGGNSWDTQANLKALAAQPWFGYGGAWGAVGATSDYTGPSAPHWPDKKSAPNDWYGPCVS